MKAIETYKVPKTELHKFLAEHEDETLQVSRITPSEIIFNIYKDVPETEFHMKALYSITQQHNLAKEELNAIDYAISAIKTLIDMGVLKDD